jgi:transposase
MLNLPPAVRLFVSRDAVDMRKAFDGLAALVRDAMREDPLSGHLFVFFNRRRDRVKILWWNRSGFLLLCKRLEAGRFTLPSDTTASADGATLRLTSTELALVLEGIDLRGAKRLKRFARDVDA